MQENVNIPDSTITTNLSFRQLVLMNMQQLTNFPYIEKDFDALTDYELLSLVVKYLNDVIANQNEQNDSITRMYESFLALQTYVNNTKDTLEDAFNELDDYVRNYFDNLDVQDEIDHKLDEYLEDGTLEHIIASYLQTQKIYNTHQEMIADADNLVNGLNVQTLGYYTFNDGGGAFYQITDTESQTDYQDDLGNDLFATLIINNIMNVAQFGAYGDNTHDDTNAIRNAINCGASEINFIKDKIYLITPFTENTSHGLLIPSNTIIDLKNATIKVIPNDKTNYKVFSFLSVNNSQLKNGKIIGDVGTHTGNTGEWGYGVSIIHSENIVLENLYISKCWGDGININFETGNTSTFYSNNITINNCVCDDNRRQGMSIEAGNNIKVNDSLFINTGQTAATNPASGVDIEPLLSNIEMKNIMFNNCVFKNNLRQQFVASCSPENSRIVSNLTLDNCIIEQDFSTTTEFIGHFITISNLKIINSLIKARNTLRFYPYDKILLENNTIECGVIGILTEKCENSVTKFVNNSFKTPSDITSRFGFIHNYCNAPNTLKNNTFIAENNEFIDKTSGDYVYKVGLINLLQTQGIDKAIITNNSFIGGESAIQVSCSSIIKNNIICGQTLFGLKLLNSHTADTEIYNDIENNNFQNTGSDNYIIWGNYTRNLTLLNNTYYPKYFNSGIGETDYAKTAFVYGSTQGYGLIQNNNIISSV